MLRRVLFTLPLIAIASVASSQNFKAANRVIVEPVGPSSFSVPTGSNFGARGTWCAAAEYAMRVLAQPGTARIYVQQPKTTPSGQVVFGLDPAGASPSAVFSTSAALRVAGSNLSIDHAIQFCADAYLTREN